MALNVPDASMPQSAGCFTTGVVCGFFECLFPGFVARETRADDRDLLTAFNAVFDVSRDHLRAIDHQLLQIVEGSVSAVR